MTNLSAFEGPPNPNRLEITKLSPERTFELTKEVFDGFELANGFKVAIGQRIDGKDGFVSDDKRQEDKILELFTPSVGNNPRVVLKPTPDWESTPEAKAPRDLLHPLTGVLLMQLRKAIRNKETGLVAQTEEGRANKRPVTEAILTFITADESTEDMANAAFFSYLAYIGEEYETVEDLTLEENFTRLTDSLKQLTELSIS